MGLTEQQAPFTEPYALAGNPRGYKSKGPTAEAVKRALAHLGFMEWAPPFDQHWNQTVNDAAAAWKRKRGLIPPDSNDGSWGKTSHDVMRSAWYGENQNPAFDSYSQDLLRKEKQAATPPAPLPPAYDLTDLRAFITEFCNKGLANANAWNYSQSRPVTVDVNPSGSSIRSDCSGSVIQAVYYGKKKTVLAVADPSKQNWTGYGNTDLYEDDWPTVTGAYDIGDLAHYQGHVTLCMKAGSWDTSDWWSFGSEPPSKRKLSYRSDFRKVVRPKYL